MSSLFAPAAMSALVEGSGMVLTTSAGVHVEDSELAPLP